MFVPASHPFQENQAHWIIVCCATMVKKKHAYAFIKIRNSSKNLRSYNATMPWSSIQSSSQTLFREQNTTEQFNIRLLFSFEEIARHGTDAMDTSRKMKMTIWMGEKSIVAHWIPNASNGMENGECQVKHNIWKFGGCIRIVVLKNASKAKYYACKLSNNVLILVIERSDWDNPFLCIVCVVFTFHSFVHRFATTFVRTHCVLFSYLPNLF